MQQNFLNTTFKGLILSRNVLNEDQGGLVIAHNVLVTRDNLVEPRHATTPIWPSQDALAPDYQWTNLFEFNSTSKRQYFLTRPTTGGTITGYRASGALTADPTLYSGGSFNSVTGSSDIRPISNFYTAYTIPRVVTDFEQPYITTTSGLSRIAYVPLTDDNPGAWTDVVPSTTPTIKHQTSFTSSVSAPWLAPGYASWVKARLRRKITNNVQNEQYIYGEFSPPFLFTNNLPKENLIPTFILNYTGYQSTTDTFEIYRTDQFKQFIQSGDGRSWINNAPNNLATSLFRRAVPFLSEADYNNFNQLSLPDSLTGEGIPVESFGNISIEEGGLRAPLCADAVTFKGYTFYGNVTKQSEGSLNVISSVALDNSTITLSQGGIPSPVTYTARTAQSLTVTASAALTSDPVTFTIPNAQQVIPGSMVIFNGSGVVFGTDSGSGYFLIKTTTGYTPAQTLYYTTPNDLTFTFTPGATGTYTLSYRAYPHEDTLGISIDENYAIALDGVSEGYKYGVSRYMLGYEGLRTSIHLGVSDPDSNIFFTTYSRVDDTILATCPATANDVKSLEGKVAAVYNSSSQIVTLFSFESVTAITGAVNQFRFNNITLVGASTGVNMGVQAVGTTTNFSDLQVYVGNGNSFLSLKQPKNQFTYALGEVQSNLDTVSGSIAGTILYYGVTRKKDSELSVTTLSSLVQIVNVNIGNTIQATILSGDSSNLPGIKFTCRTHGVDLYAAASTGFINVRPSLTTTAAQITERPRVPNGFLTSRLNIPSFLTVVPPNPIGVNSNKFLRWAKNTNDLFAFCSDGIYLVKVAETNSFPRIDEVELIDSTILLYASESVQEVNENIFFLSSTGVFALNGSRLTVVSESIRTLIQNLIAKVDPSKIRSTSNEYRKQYKIHFPYVNVDGTGVSLTYSIETGEWTASDEAWSASMVDSTNKLLLASYDQSLPASAYTGTGNTLISNNFLTDFRSSYVRREVWTGDDQDVVYDNVDNVVTNNLLDTVYVDILGANNPNAANDQIELILDAWTSVTKIGNTITFVKNPVGTGTSGSLAYTLSRFKGKQLYIRATLNNVAGSFIPCSIVSYNATTQVLIVSWDKDTYGEIELSQSAEPDALALGVNAEIEFRPFHANQPQTNKKFGEVSYLTQDFLPTSLQTSFAVDTALFGTYETVDSQVVQGQTLFRTYIPREQARGRILRVRLKHGTPKERFTLNGFSLKYNDSNSTATTKEQ